LARKSGFEKFEIQNPKNQNILSTHYISRASNGALVNTSTFSTADLRTSVCSSSNSGCVNLNDKEKCGSESELKCLLSGQCIDKQWLCDGINDCGLWEDEINCKGNFLVKN
jgi:hypothetical protein